VKNNHFDIRYLMAPEIMNLEQKQVGKAWNVFSLAVCIYYLIEGKFLFQGNNKQEIYYSIIHDGLFPF
jgi:hypothetical protein